MATLERTRSRVEGELRAARDGLDVPELAQRLGLHANTIRWHLAALADAGVVSSAPHPRAGRGRPRIVYRVHKGLIDGSLEELGSDLRISGLDVFVEPGLCVARLSRTTSKR